MDSQDELHREFKLFNIFTSLFCDFLSNCSGFIWAFLVTYLSHNINIELDTNNTMGIKSSWNKFLFLHNND